MPGIRAGGRISKPIVISLRTCGRRGPAQDCQRFVDDNNNLNLDYTNGVMTNSGFGILPRDNKYGRRIVQLAFKYYF